MSTPTFQELMEAGKNALAKAADANTPENEKTEAIKAANRLFSAAVAQNPTSADAQVFKGLTAMDLGDEDTARTALENALQLDPSNDMAKRALDQINRTPPPPDQQQPNLDPQPAARNDDGIIDDDDDPPTRRNWRIPRIPRWLWWILAVLVALALLLWWSPWRSWSSGPNTPSEQREMTAIPNVPSPSPTPAQAGQLPTAAPAATVRPTNAIPTTTGPTTAPAATNTPTRTATPTATTAPTNTPTRTATPAATVAPTTAAYPAPLTAAAPTTAPAAPAAIAPGTTKETITGTGTLDNPFKQELQATNPITSAIVLSSGDGLQVKLLTGNGDLLLTWRNANGIKTGDALVPVSELSVLRQITAEEGQSVEIKLIPSSGQNLKVEIFRVLASAMSPNAGNCDDYESCKDD